MSQMNFCCDRMRSAIEDPEIPIIYIPKFREFGVRVLDGGTSNIGLLFCPWCGQKLPESLRDFWFDELERLGIDPTGDEIPTEFCDERWYETRDFQRRSTQDQSRSN
jgi:hypothetical protein